MKQYSLFLLVAQWPSANIVDYKCIKKVNARSIKEVCKKLGVVNKGSTSDKAWRVEPDSSEKGTSLKKEKKKMEAKKRVRSAELRVTQFSVTLDKELS